MGKVCWKGSMAAEMPSRTSYLVYYIVLYLFVTNCKLSLVNSLSLYVLYFARIVPPRISLLVAGNTFVILFVY